MWKTFLPCMACLGFLLVPDLSAEESGKDVPAQSFDGAFLGMAIQAERLGVVLDVSSSMTRNLPALRAALKQRLPRAPMLMVDGCGLEPPDSRPHIANGVAPETVTAVTTLVKQAHVDAILWISDMGDPHNTKGIEAMEKALAEHGIQLYLLSVKAKPGPSLRELAIDSDGFWKVVSLKEANRSK